MASIQDISQPLGATTAVWPGDRPFELDWTLRRERGDSVDAAAVALSVHTGTHVDGPRHTGGGPGAGELALESFVGPAEVVDARPHIDGDPPVVAETVLEGLDPERAPRVLLWTGLPDDATRFPERFAALAPALCRRLVDRGFRLVGTDAPSVDPRDSKKLESHRILAGGGIPNLENLALSGVAPGRYLLVALPLKLIGADSSPVRAVLISGDLKAFSMEELMGRGTMERRRRR